MRLPRVLLAAPGSGGGKTTLTCGLLRLCREMGLAPAALKAGPDYIDPMFHREASGGKTGNLDLFFTGEATVRALLAKAAMGCDIALLEGVMGYYDGIYGADTKGSSYHLARATGTPVILGMDPKGAALSVGAVVHGFATFRPEANIRGVIFNKCSKAMYEYLAPGVEAQGIPVIGYLPDDSRFAVGSRHLGLIGAGELPDVQALLGGLAATLKETLDWERLWQIASSAPDLAAEPYVTAPMTKGKPRLGVAYDKAFCFYYRENLEMLEELGVEIVLFSPLKDEAPPRDLDGLYLGGGYPELYGEELSANAAMRYEVRRLVQAGTPTVAECGGFLYLQQKLKDEAGKVWPMAGALEGQSGKEDRLRQFGYITITAEDDNLYCPMGGSIAAHEFHYWHSTQGGSAFRADKPAGNRSWPCMVAGKNLAAGFPHLYYPANPAFARRFVQAMERYRTKSRKKQ